jgi:general secretion pathway protein B
MSFILDALKKSENDRQRQTGPALFEVRVPPPRSKFPLLAVAIVGLLVVNLGVVGWLMLREPAEAAVPAAQTGGTPPQPGATNPPQAVPGQQFGREQYLPAPGQQGSSQGQYPPAQGQYAQGGPGQYPPAQGAPAQGGFGQPGQVAPGGFQGQPGAYGQPTQPNGYPAQGNFGGSNAGATYDEGPALNEPMLRDDVDPLNPDDYEPAREPDMPAANASHVVRSNTGGLPSYEEAATRTTIPAVRLDLHSYAADPTKRFVLINMKRLYEGQSLPEGVKVESITSDAAIMSYNGTRFVLSRD